MTGPAPQFPLFLLRRPMLLCALFFAGGILAGSAQLYPVWAWVALVLAALVMTLALPGLIAARLASVALAAFAVGALAWHARHAGPEGDPLSRLIDVDGLPVNATIEGVVRLQHLDNDRPEELSCVVDADAVELSGERHAVAGGVLVSCAGPPWTVHAGERVRATGEITARFGCSNFGVPSYETYWACRDVFSRLRAADRRGTVLERVAAAPWWSGRYWMSRLRKAEADRLEQTMPPGPLPFVKAIWLGYRASMPRHEYRKYVRAGVAHILSVSGIHASILFVTVGFLLRFVVKNRRWWALLTMLAVGVFAVTTGVRPSALRAALMITVFLSAEVAGRQPDALSALGLSALCLLGWNPDLMFDTGFQLSFLSLASILLFSGRLDEFLPFPALFRKPVATSLGVQILPLPVAISRFYLFPAAGVLVNLAVIPLSAAILWLTFVTLVVSTVSISAAAVFGHAVSPLFWVVAQLADAVASSDWTWLRVAAPAAPAQLAFWGAAFCMLGAAGAARRAAWLRAAAVLAVAAALTWRLYVPEARVDFLSVRGGDAIVVMSPGGGVMLVDGGDAHGGFSNGEEYVAPYLWAHHVRRLDYVVASHADRDHLGGLFYMVENFGVGEVWLPDTADRTPLEAQFEALCERRRVPIRHVAAGFSISLDEMTVRVLHPPGDWTPGRTANECSIVLSVEHEGTRVLLTGDVEQAGERLLAGQDCRAGVAKAPHHGSATSSCEELLAAVAPSHAVVSCAGAASERVSTEVIERYRRHGCEVWRTDVHGGVRVKLGDRAAVSSVRAPHKKPLQ